MPVYPHPGAPGAPHVFKERYENYIGGKAVPPIKGAYMDCVTPLTGKVYAQAARSDAADIEAALDAAHAAADAWGATTATHRAALLNKIADRLEANAERLAYVETVVNGKPIRESLAADVPLAIDHFRYFAGVLRAQEGHFTELDGTTVAYHHHEPLGVVGCIVPWNFSLLMPVWKLAPALAGGNAVVMKPAESTAASVVILMEVIGDLLPPGVVNIVTGYGPEAGAPLAASKRIAKLAFTGSTAVGKKVAAAAAANIIPCTLELGGKSPNIFFKDIMDADDAFFDKALEGFTMFALNSGEVCTCPSRALIDESIYDAFMERALKRVAQIKLGDPLDTETMLGAQNSKIQLERILNYLRIGKEEGAQVLAGGEQAALPGDLSGGYYVRPTVFKGTNDMRVFQEEIFGPVVSVTTFKTEAEAVAIANSTFYGLGAGVFTRDINRGARVAKAIKAGRVWLNCYHLYNAGASFGGYKQSGVGRETYKTALEGYQQLKCVLQSTSASALGFF